MQDRGNPLTLYNSLTRTVAEFVPIDPQLVRIYTCGPTVYAYPHIGNLRAYLLSDTLSRALRWKGYPVRKIVNITDVGHLVADADEGEDKMETAARTSSESVFELARRYEAAFHEDLAKLRILPADEYPRASEWVPEMIRFAERLEERGYAYRLPSGLYFDTSKSPGYGRLGMIKVEEQLAGARVQQVEGKRNPNDFALWRTEAPGTRRLIRWESPWGWGAPGWHLECSVMSISLLGDHFDIHTGGVDHRELHHVNEIAQSEAYLGDGRDWVNYWIHGEFLTIREAKMAKSEQTGLRLVDLEAAGVAPAAYRLMMMMAHYRTQVDYSLAAARAAGTTLRRLRQRIVPLLPLPQPTTYAAARQQLASDEAIAALDRIDRAISEDLATPQVVAELHEVLRSAIPPAEQAVLVGAVEQLLALALDQPDEQLGTSLSDEEIAEIEAKVAERNRARAARDWATADAIRQELSERGIVLRDSAEGTVWELAES